MWYEPQAWAVVASVGGQFPDRGNYLLQFGIRQRARFLVTP